MFLLSYDASSDLLMDRIIPFLSGSSFGVMARRSDQMTFSTISTPDAPSDMEIEAQLRNLIKEGSVFSTFDRKSGRPFGCISPMQLTFSQLEAIEELLERMDRGDLVLSIMDILNKDGSVIASYLSERAIEKGAFSLLFAINRPDFKGISDVEDASREYLKLSLSFHGIAAIPPKVIRDGTYLRIAQLFRHLGLMAFKPGLVNLDRADLMFTSKGGVVLVMTTGASIPGGRASISSVKEAMENPLCDIDLTTIRKVMVNVVGGRDMTLEDSLLAAEVLQDSLPEDARLIWGVSIDEELEGDTEVFLILATTPMELMLHWYSVDA